MSRRKTACEVTRKSETAGMPDHSTVLTMGTSIVYRKLAEVGRSGITTRDFPGWDVRHYIRVMKESGIGFDFTWEKNELGGQHKRWWLKDGHSHIEIPYPKKTKPTTGATVLASISNKTSIEMKGELPNE